MDNVIGSEFGGRVRMYQDRMSRTEQQIAQYILRHEKEVSELSVQALSEAAGVGVASIVRLCKTLGYDGYADMKYQLRQRKLTITASDVGISDEDDAHSVKQKVLRFAEEALDKCVMQADDATLDAVSDCIARAGKVLLVGSGTAAALAEAGAAMFLSLGIFAFSVEDTMLHLRNAIFLEPGDLMMALCYTGYSKDIGDAMLFAQESGAKVLLITSRRDSLLGKYADFELHTIVRNMANSVNVTTTSICQLAILQVLQAMVQKKRGPEAAARAARVRSHGSITTYDTKQTAIYHRSVRQSET